MKLHPGVKYVANRFNAICDAHHQNYFGEFRAVVEDPGDGESDRKRQRGHQQPKADIIAKLRCSRAGGIHD